MEENIIYIGQKSPMVYAKFINSKLSQTKEVILKTRGKSILNAITVASFLQYNNQVVIRNIKLSG